MIKALGLKKSRAFLLHEKKFLRVPAKDNSKIFCTFARKMRGRGGTSAKNELSALGLHRPCSRNKLC
jgi:hypothetical protein